MIGHASLRGPGVDERAADDFDHRLDHDRCLQFWQMTASGRLDNHAEGRHVYREDARIENQNQVMVIQCR
jgi:hypothetical protein